jgi:hypothetical protein
MPFVLLSPSSCVYCSLKAAVCTAPTKLPCVLFPPSCCVYCSLEVALLQIPSSSYV